MLNEPRSFFFFFFKAIVNDLRGLKGIFYPSKNPLSLISTNWGNLEGEGKGENSTYIE
jgi:hypothetical protein